jgi:hypothetical protein
MVDRAAARSGDAEAESDISSGSLFASGLIAAGGIAGLIGVALKAVEATYMENRDILNFPRGTILDHTWVSVIAFGLLGYALYYFARRPLKK